MDSTLFTIFFVLGLGLVWLIMFVVKHNISNPATTTKQKSVKEELFGKRKKKKDQSWSIDQN